MKASFPRVPGAVLAPAMFSLIATSAADAEPFAYVPNGETGAQVVVIDTASNTRTAVVNVGLNPFDVAITPDGDFAYVANYHGGEFSNDPDTVSVIDTASNTVIATVGVGRESQPSAIAITPDGAFAYVTNDGSDTISVIDTASNTVTATIPVISISILHGIAITPDGAFAYVTNPTGTVSVIDTASNTVAEILDVDGFPGVIAITPDGAFAYVATGDRISVIDTATNTVTTTVPGAAGAIAFTPDGAFAYISSGGDPEGGQISVIDTSSNTVVATVPVGENARDIAITPDGAFAYVAHYEPESSISVIETATNTVTTTLRADAFAIAITPEPQAIEVGVDILPGNKKNRINLRSKGNMAVAVLSTGKFDATQVDWETVTFGPRDATELHQRSHIRDVDRDGDMDFVLHFKIRKTGIECGDKKATLAGETFSGQAFAGSDRIKAIKCR